VAVDTPFAGVLDYSSPDQTLAHGDWVLAPFGKKEVLGLVVKSEKLARKSAAPSADSSGLINENSAPDPFLGSKSVVADKIRSIHGRLEIFPPADEHWIAFMAFAARYYRRPFGSIAVGLLPKWLRDPKNFLAKGEARKTNFERLLQQPALKPQEPAEPAVQLNLAQQAALKAIAHPGVHVLHGVTGSGKTRVYTEAASACLAQDPAAQILIMVPEIGLTPQLVGRFTRALPGVEIAVLHSEISERERARLWLACATGRARLVIGTRLSIMTPLPRLRLIMIDEEHDHSYKQQEGMRYSARDLAVWRAQQLGASLVLGSATPSIETWAQITRNKYQRLCLPERATGEPAAPIRLIDTLKDPAREGLSTESRTAIAGTLASGGQVLVFLNRRGYAPVLSCGSCGWASNCRDCSVPTVLHRTAASLTNPRSQSQWRLQCHHCGLITGVPRQCPDCGDTDLAPVGRGVQRLEQTLQEAFPEARILRIDRDSVKQGKALQAELDRIERGEVDIVVGTQMLAKGHDFARMRLVLVADADTQLLNPDFRAPERLFATLMQVAGRAGRHEQSGAPAQVLIQTRYPQHRLYQFLIRQDVEGFARAEMEDRQNASLPPFSYMAAVRAAHLDPLKAQTGLKMLRSELELLIKASGIDGVVYGPIARYPEIQAGKWRGQLLLESSSRQALHQLLGVAEQWIGAHRSMDAHVDVDPQEV
jgi:primosomal protein N' (replication factor Y) (superfamily II helicase)